MYTQTQITAQCLQNAALLLLLIDKTHTHAWLQQATQNTQSKRQPSRRVLGHLDQVPDGIIYSPKQIPLQLTIDLHVSIHRL